MHTFNLYIGANNRTRRVELRKIERILSQRHEGFTVYPVTGYWHGQRENSVIVVVADDKPKVLETISLLREALEQEAIGYQLVPQLQFAWSKS